MAALIAAREAVADAGWKSHELADAALVLGTSRGNAAGWLGEWPGRRPFKLMAASNTMHGEAAGALSIELGIHGPNHVVASGCAAGLDAVGIAMLMLRGGLAERVLVVAVDLPLVPLLLDNYAASGLFSTKSSLDPYHPETDGFIPGEGAAAIAITNDSHRGIRLIHHGCNSDGVDPLGIPGDGGRTPALFEKIPAGFPVSAVCPHATGTAVQAKADPALLCRSACAGAPLHLLKPYVGHTIGASGLIETVLLAAFMCHGSLPQNKPGLFAPEGFSLPDSETTVSGPVAKLCHAMGGHNSLLVLAP